MWLDEASVVVKTSPPVTSLLVSYRPSTAAPLPLFPCRVGPINLCAPIVSHCGCIDRVYLAIAPGWKFDLSLFVFLDFVANLQTSYLELGVSK